MAGGAGYIAIMAAYADMFLGATDRWASTAEKSEALNTYSNNLITSEYAEKYASDAWFTAWEMLDNYTRIWGAGAKTGYDNPHAMQLWYQGIYDQEANDYGFASYNGITQEQAALLAYLSPELFRQAAEGGSFMEFGGNMEEYILPALAQAL